MADRSEKRALQTHGEGHTPRTFIREVVLENFMSHEYSRIPFTRGLNVIVGPNGAGKSSILLGISVALGQSYTERGERLSDLVKRGSEAARVAVVLDNTPINGKRPIPQYSTDTVTITRFLKKNGDYWQYINNRFKPKAEVEHFLSQIGINPNNMLIIMHQNMIEQFVVRDSREKLLLIEEAVGASGLRQRIREAESKLAALAAEEKVLKKTLDDARAAVEFWREEYEKLTILRRLNQRKDELEREYLWALVNEAKKSRERVESTIRGIQQQLEETAREAEETDLKVRGVREKITSLFDAALSGGEDLRGKLAALLDELIDNASLSGALRQKLKTAEQELKSLRYELLQIEKELQERVENAEKRGPRVETSRRHQEIYEDIKSVMIQIAGMGKVTPEAEDMFLLAESKYRETELKAGEVSENVRRALEEVEYRKEVWRRFLRELIADVEPQYDSILSKVGGRGRIELKNLDDVDRASIELYAGFRGAEPTLLDGHSQSGGERIVATMAFLLALQRHVKSPFRAVDEFDVHLDPLNRERIIRLLTETAREDSSAQYIIITPGKVSFTEDMNVVIVQNVSGRSSVGVGKAEKVAADA
ncbi:MAG: AAA family ATPase [Aigarchaeota archaeon]|nr:AAA family ATPase [Candidatus Pelearchaeum maunauluense]